MSSVPSRPDPTGRIPYLDSLRVLASFFVMWNHVEAHEALGFESPWIRTVVGLPNPLQGKMVLLFFVITGLVFSVVLSKNRASPLHLPSFALGRILRLWIPSAALVVATAAMYWVIVPKGFTPLPQSLTLGGFFTQLFLLADFSPNHTWDTEACILWNIPIQIQFVLLASVISLGCPVPSARAVALLLTLSLLGLFTTSRGWVFGYLPFFTAGIAIYLMGVAGDQRKGIVLYLLSVAGVCLHWNLATCAILLVPLLARLVPLFHGSGWSGLARISFSLYLVHFLVSQRLLNLFRPHVDTDPGRMVLFVSALLCSILAAYVFYRLVEHPSHRLARWVSQGPSRSQPGGASSS